MADPQQYIKFMSDIIDSGTWASLSSGARALYPVLLKFSDQNFKQVWPSTSTLLKLTGFKTKKSVIDAKKDLIDSGLIQTKSGSGHANSIYYFTFNYPGSKITPLWDTPVYHPGVEKSTPGEEENTPRGDATGNPNQINITITNNQIQKEPKKSKKKKSDRGAFEAVLEEYGEEIFNYAYAIAKTKSMENNIAYIRAICKNKTEELIKRPNFEHKPQGPSWRLFLEWAGKHLTRNSLENLKDLEIQAEPNKLIIFGQISGFLQEVILRYFEENSETPISILFNESPKKNRIFA